MPFGSFLAALGQGAFGVGTAMNQYQKQVSDDDAAEAQAKQAAEQARQAGVAQKLSLWKAGLNPRQPGAAVGPNDFNDGANSYGFNYENSDEGKKATREAALATQKETATTKAKDQINQMAYGALQRSFKDHPLSAAPYNPGVDYRDELKSAENPGKYSSAGITAEKGLARYTASLKPDKPEQFTIMQGTGTDGKQHIFRVPKVSGDAQQVDGMEAKAAAGGGGQNAPQMAAAKTNLESARNTMDDFEAKLLAGTASYGPLDATKGALGSSEQTQTAHGVFGGINSLAGNLAGASLRDDNPELSKYLKAKKFTAEAILNTHKRPNQTQYEIEQELSGIGPSLDGKFTSPQMASLVAQSKDRRDRMYNDVFANPNAGAVAGTAPQHGSSSTPASPVPQLLSGGPSAPASRPPLSARVTQLKSMGLSKSAAMAQLQHEGYDLHNEE
jgi:hypothetical protein